MVISDEGLEVLRAIRDVEGVGDTFLGTVATNQPTGTAPATLNPTSYQPQRSLKAATGMSGQQLSTILKQLKQYGYVVETTRLMSPNSTVPTKAWRLTDDGRECLEDVPFLPYLPHVGGMHMEIDCGSDIDASTLSALYEQLRECVAQTWALATMYEPQFRDFYATQYTEVPVEYIYETLQDAHAAWVKQIGYTLQLSDAFDTSSNGQRFGQYAADVKQSLQTATAGGGLDEAQYRAIFLLLFCILEFLRGEEMQHMFGIMTKMFGL